jgi:hypothetical protein
MNEPQQLARPSGQATEVEYVEFWPAGTLAAGRFLCAACGNAVSVKTALPRCMLCGECLWEREETSPYARVS